MIEKTAAIRDKAMLIKKNTKKLNQYNDELNHIKTFEVEMMDVQLMLVFQD